MNKLYGLLGRRLSHSFSQKFFTEKFTSEHLDAEYRNFEIQDIGEFMELLAEYPMLSGLNVTIPYKQQIIPYMDSLDMVATEVGAVNVVNIKRDHNGELLSLIGYNSDVYGFVNSIKPLINENCKEALVLGSGGASKAVTYGLGTLGIESHIVSRTPCDGQISYNDLTPEIMSRCLVIVNTTPLGMYPDVDTFPPIPYELLTQYHICYDLVYNPEVTLFMTKAKNRGCTVKNGLEMLHLQALESWSIWNG